MQNKTPILVISAVILLALGGAGAMWLKASNAPESEGDLTQVSMDENGTPGGTENDIESAAGDSPAPTLAPEPEAAPAPMPAPTLAADAPAPAPVTDAGVAAVPAAPEAAAAVPSLDGPMTAPAAAPVSIVVEGTDPKFPKAVGSLDAPVTMYDFSSLTCPHCAHAHEQVLPFLIKEYVETGKLRIVFSDFPLNAEAMAASKVARCMPGDKYYAFISLLFSTQEQWMAHMPDALIQNAVMAGLPEDKARACLEDQDIEKAIVANVQENVNKYQLSSTPTFVLNDGKKVIMGARPYIDFKMAIDGLLEETKK